MYYPTYRNERHMQGRLRGTPRRQVPRDFYDFITDAISCIVNLLAPANYWANNSRVLIIQELLRRLGIEDVSSLVTKDERDQVVDQIRYRFGPEKNPHGVFFNLAFGRITLTFRKLWTLHADYVLPSQGPTTTRNHQTVSTLQHELQDELQNLVLDYLQGSKKRPIQLQPQIGCDDYVLRIWFGHGDEIILARDLSRTVQFDWAKGLPAGYELYNYRVDKSISVKKIAIIPMSNCGHCILSSEKQDQIVRLDVMWELPPEGVLQLVPEAQIEATSLIPVDRELVVREPPLSDGLLINNLELKTETLQPQETLREPKKSAKPDLAFTGKMLYSEVKKLPKLSETVNKKCAVVASKQLSAGPLLNISSRSGKQLLKGSKTVSKKPATKELQETSEKFLITKSSYDGKVQTPKGSQPASEQILSTGLHRNKRSAGLESEPPSSPTKEYSPKLSPKSSKLSMKHVTSFISVLLKTSVLKALSRQAVTKQPSGRAITKTALNIQPTKPIMVTPDEPPNMQSSLVEGSLKEPLLRTVPAQAANEMKSLKGTPDAKQGQPEISDIKPITSRLEAIPEKKDVVQRPGPSFVTNPPVAIVKGLKAPRKPAHKSLADASNEAKPILKAKDKKPAPLRQIKGKPVKIPSPITGKHKKAAIPSRKAKVPTQPAIVKHAVAEAKKLPQEDKCKVKSPPPAKALKPRAPKVPKPYVDIKDLKSSSEDDEDRSVAGTPIKTSTRFLDEDSSVPTSKDAHSEASDPVLEDLTPL
ncbi:uncharacterized protein LOC111267477 [Varroa jacobsoni]|uniref:uncharacterized protein LOC111267477 n=1 Tax=Varroa jacobsoni TaxID=62625 RepID=UPI000BF3092C|nr:uncharacterized protein LOC111267477 [Varroa jacobsoni]